MGEATDRYGDRALCSLGKGGHALPLFHESEAICGGGVLFLLPALLSQGLLKASNIYTLPSTDYYSLESIVLTLAFMALSRIKNPEQLKLCKPGEIGRLIGMDRIPEMRCLRNKIKCLSDQKQSTAFNNVLIDLWYPQHDDTNFLYIDGHVRIYYGKQANLPSKFISRQKLCLSATSEFWVNDAKGLPVLMVLGELTEKLQTVIEQQIIDRLIQAKLINPDISNIDKPQCTLVFDREAYDIIFFQRLWDKYRIAILTYRKNVKDKWDEKKFKKTKTSVMEQDVTMYLCEDKVTLNGYCLREIRRLSDNGHQVAIITNNQHLDINEVAGRMFARWSQENFFRYLIQDYDFDKMIEYGVEDIDSKKEVVNPEYRKLTNKLKRIREKKARTEAKFYPLVEQAMNKEIDQIPAITEKQMEYLESIRSYARQEEDILEKRSKISSRIKLEQMPEHERYDKLKTESKIFMNVIKMISYRAETVLANLLAPCLTKTPKEKRMVVKQIIKSSIDLIPDYLNKTLTVKLYSLAANRYNQAVKNIIPILNDTETIFPGTDLQMVFTLTSAI